VSVDETIGLLTDRFAKEGEKLPESEKTALNVISLMLPVLLPQEEKRHLLFMKLR
jgi:hypothetical protein